MTINENTIALWYQVLEKNGRGSCRLAVNGLGEVELLSSDYMTVLANGSEAVEAMLVDMLNN